MPALAVLSWSGSAPAACCGIWHFKVPLAVVKLLPKVCELAWTILGARLGTVPKWWRGGQAEGRGACPNVAPTS